MINQNFFSRDTLTVAENLIGTTLVVGECEGRIVETEAYKTDAASHAAKKTNRSALMYETFGHIYVYLNYGMYFCLNFTCEQTGVGAVLIRAIEPIKGIELMKKRREIDDLNKLTNGPGKLSMALGIDLRFNGQLIGQSIKLRERADSPQIAISPRIGITKATELDWRFFEKGNRFVSHFKATKSTLP
ncbi:MAG: DNA-3-methyladenine glycosylase [Acidobacteriota bacterium]